MATGFVILSGGCGCTQRVTWLPKFPGLGWGNAPEPPKSLHLRLGNPSQANGQQRENYLILRPQYALSYNQDKHIPNWASWWLDRSWLGEMPRSPLFEPDPSLPQGWDRAEPQDYNGSGYDRGHLTPSRDRSNSRANNQATFFMTNILPQAPDNNQGPWERLESYCRDLVFQGKSLYIIAGGYGQQKTIGGRRKISVPTHLWKIVVVMERGGAGADETGSHAAAPESTGVPAAIDTAIAPLSPNTRVIAVDMPNTQGIEQRNWRNYRTTVKALEAKTGYDFLSNLADPLETALEQKVDQIWDRQTPRDRGGDRGGDRP